MIRIQDNHVLMKGHRPLRVRARARRANVKENRNTLRFECQEELFFQLDGVSHEARVMDISRGGVRVQTSTKLPVGRNLFLRIKDKSRGRVPVKAVVRWRRGEGPYEMGLEFRESTSKLSRRWVRKLFPQEGKAWAQGHQQRSEVRALVDLPVVDSNGFSEGKILDISPSGARIQFEQKLEGTTGLYLCLPWSYLEVRANVLRVEADDSKWVHSVRFAPIGEAASEELKGFIEHTLI